MNLNIDKIVDAKGLSCPMPIVKTKKAIDTLESGQLLEILTTDKGAKNDLTAWVKSGNHTLISSSDNNGVLSFVIQKG